MSKVHPYAFPRANGKDGCPIPRKIPTSVSLRLLLHRPLHHFFGSPLDSAVTGISYRNITAFSYGKMKGRGHQLLSSSDSSRYSFEEDHELSSNICILSPTISSALSPYVLSSMVHGILLLAMNETTTTLIIFHLSFASLTSFQCLFFLQVHYNTAKERPRRWKSLMSMYYISLQKRSSSHSPFVLCCVLLRGNLYAYRVVCRTVSFCGFSFVRVQFVVLMTIQMWITYGP